MIERSNAGTHGAPVAGLLVPFSRETGNLLMLNTDSEYVVPVYTSETLLHRQLEKLSIPNYEVRTITHDRDFVNSIPHKYSGKKVVIIRDMRDEGDRLEGDELLRD
jgi:phospholipid N-methyltransferase